MRNSIFAVFVFLGYLVLVWGTVRVVEIKYTSQMPEVIRGIENQDGSQSTIVLEGGKWRESFHDSKPEYK